MSAKKPSSRGRKKLRLGSIELRRQRKFSADQSNKSEVSQIQRIDKLSTAARSSWFAMIGYLSFVGITLLGVNDADFFIQTRQTQLPIVNISIPTSSFFFFGPILGAALYIYLHLHLLKLWEALRVPSAIANKVSLSDRVSPWLVNDLALAIRGGGANSTRSLNWLSYTATFVLLFLACPLLLLFFWIRYWPSHDEWTALAIGLAFLLCCLVGVSSLTQAIGQFELGSSVIGARVRRLLFWLIAIVGTCSISLISWAKTEGFVVRNVEGTSKVLLHVTNIPPWLSSIGVSQAMIQSIPLPDSIERFHAVDGDKRPILALSQAHLDEVEFVNKPASWKSYDAHQLEFRGLWCKREGLPSDICGQSPSRGQIAPSFQSLMRKSWCSDRSLDDRSCATHFAALEVRYLDEWVTERRAAIDSLEKIDLSESDLRDAKLSRAFLVGVDMRKSDLSGAQIFVSDFEGANLTNAKLVNLQAFGSSFRHAEIVKAELSNSSFLRAFFQGANLRQSTAQSTDFAGANFVSSKLSGLKGGNARFWNTDFYGADLTTATLENTEFQSAIFENSDLWRTNFSSSVLDSATFENSLVDNTNFSGASMSQVRFIDSLVNNSNFTSAKNLADVKNENSASLFANKGKKLPSFDKCWSPPPSNFESLLQMRSRHSPMRNVRMKIIEERFRKKLLCN